MNLFTAISAAAVISGSLITTATPVSASDCYPSTASKIIREVVRGGGSSQEALDAAVADGSINSEGCVVRVRGYMRGYSSIYSDVLRAMNW